MPTTHQLVDAACTTRSASRPVRPVPGGPARRRPAAARTVWAGCLLLVLLPFCRAAERPPLPDAPELSQLLEELKQYEHGKPRAPLTHLESVVARATGNAASAGLLADRLADLLRDPETTPAAKCFACGQLALIGSEKQVPVLHKLLAAPETADMARQALEGIPGEPSLLALRSALAVFDPALLPGVINSLGRRRDPAAVPSLAPLLSSTSSAVAQSAAMALAKIATVEAAEALVGSSPAPDGSRWLHDARLACAGGLAKTDAQHAARMYETIWASDRPAQWRVGALVGLARVDPGRALPKALEALRTDNTLVQMTAVRVVEAMPGQEATRALAEQLPTLAPELQVSLLNVLAQREGDDAKRVAHTLIEGENGPVRIAAAQAVGRLGDASTVARLTALAAETGGELQQAARDALARLHAPGVEQAVGAAAATGSTDSRAEAVRAMGARGDPVHTAYLLTAARDPEARVRREVFDALGRLCPPESYPKLVGLLTAATAADQGAAEKAVLAAASRAGTPAAKTAPVLEAIGRARPHAKAALLRLLSAFGSTQGLRVVQEHVDSTDSPLRDAGIRALAKWPDTAAAPGLLAIARSAENMTHRVLALRGYLRLAAGLQDGKGRLDMIARIGPLAQTTAEKKLLLGALGDVDDPAVLDVCQGFLGDPETRAEAALAMIKAGNAVMTSDREAVKRAMAKVAQAATDKDLLAQVKALHAEALKSPPTSAERQQALRPDAARTRRQRQAIADAAPEGYRLVCYLDCGPDRGDGDGPAIRLVAGEPYVWGSGRATADQLRHTAVFFASREVTFELTGLQPTREYKIGFSWWDYDHNTRVQSVWAAAGKPARLTRLLPATKLPSGRSAGPGTETVSIPRTASARRTCRASFRNEGSPNAVVSEVWLWESEAESEPPPVTDRKKGGTPVLLLTGVDYPGHKWQQTAPVLADLLLADPRLDVDVVEDPAFIGSGKLRKYKVIVLHMMNWEQPNPPPEALERFRGFVEAGGGLVLVHFACGAFQGWPEFVKIAGRVWDPKMRGHDPRGPFKVDITAPDHPLLKGMTPFETDDELYTCLDGDTQIEVLAAATSKVDGKPYPMAFVLTYGRGRVFHCPLGHDVRAFAPPAVGELFRRGTAWAAGLPPVRQEAEE